MVGRIIYREDPAMFARRVFTLIFILTSRSKVEWSEARRTDGGKLRFAASLGAMELIDDRAPAVRD